VATDETARVRAKFEAIALAATAATCARLEEVSQERVKEWLQEHRGRINSLPDARRTEYDEVRQLAVSPEPTMLNYPESIEAQDVGDRWQKHVYAAEDGSFPAKLGSKWESMVLRAALDGAVGWYRNTPRKKYSLCVPYEAGGEYRSLYPDFLIIRESRGHLEVDILDPHSPGLADSAQKVTGLARYAAKHAHQFGKIEAIIVNGERILRLDLAQESVRDKVKLITTSEQLVSLFES
jgi:type III restriction enzyme